MSSFDSPECPLVQWTPRHRLHIVPILLCVRSHRVSIERLLVVPHLDHRKVVRARGVLRDVETEASCLGTARLGQFSEHRRHIDLPAATDVYVRNDDDSVATLFVLALARS
jgi:hypothetical protein